MVRFDPEKTDEVMEKEGAGPMDFTNKVIRGFAFVDIDALNTKKKLAYRVNLAPEYNKVAKSARKKKKSKS